MKILIIDRDEVSAQLIQSRLQGEDVMVTVEPSKGDAADRLATEAFDMVFVDPAPMKDAQAILMSIRRSSRNYCYVTVMGEDVEMDAVAALGANSALKKPIDPEKLQESVASAKNLLAYSKLLSDLGSDFPSSGGVISKSAFNQLYLSSIDRSWRYSEKSYILSVSIENFDEIKSLDGDQHAAFGASKLAHHLVKLRRQSDVIGQVRENEYFLLLQRTAHDDEAKNAAKRFAANLDEIDDFIPAGGSSLKVKVSLVELPTGKSTFEHVLLKRES